MLAKTVAPPACAHLRSLVPYRPSSLHEPLNNSFSSAREEHAAVQSASRIGHNFSRIAIHAAYPLRLQAKLTVGQPGDIYEHEADAVAEQVIQRRHASGLGGDEFARFSSLPVREIIQCQETSFPPDSEEQLQQNAQLQKKPETSTNAKGSKGLANGFEGALVASRTKGQSFHGSVKNEMERDFGACFDKVRIHADSEAAGFNRVLNAEAFAYGNDIYFAEGKYDHSSDEGLELLAHELTHTLQQGAVRRKAVQFRGGSKVGNLSVNTNVISEGLTAGHAWLGYTAIGGAMTTYGTWGNRPHKGLNRDIELGYSPKAKRITDLDSVDYSALTSFAAANDDWGYINNCASFAARGWLNVTGESLDYTTALIPNPSALGAGIVAANGGATGILVAAAPGTGSSSETGDYANSPDAGASNTSPHDAGVPGGVPQ